MRTKSNGDVEFGAMIFMGRTETLGGAMGDSTIGPRRAPCDSVSLEAGLSELASEVRSQFPGWLDRFVAAISAESK